MLKLSDGHTWKARTGADSCCLVDFLPLLTMLDQLRATASKQILVTILLRVSCLHWVSNAVQRLGMTMNKMLLSVPGSGTTHGGWAPAWPSHKLLRQVQNASRSSATRSVKANVTLSCDTQLWQHKGTQAKQYTKIKDHSYLACHGA